MTIIQKILRGIQISLKEDGPAALGVEVETALRAMRTSDSVYRHEDIAEAIFGSLVSEEELAEEKDA